MKHFLELSLCSLVLLAIASCSGGRDGNVTYSIVHYQPEYAGGFDIVGIEGYESHVLRVKMPWQGADTAAMCLFISKDGENPPCGFHGKTIKSGAARLAVMSSSYIGMLSSIGASECIAAVSGLDFISDPDVVSRKSSIAEIGADSSPDYEGLLSAGVDAVLLYGIASANTMTQKLDVLGIPYIYIGEYLERSPLGRAEWIVVLSEIVGRPEDGKAAFNEIAGRYNALKSILSSVPDRPKVMLNAPYGDSWFMASSSGIMSSLIHDAGGEYVYRQDNGNRTVAISMEKALLLAGEADFWLDVGGISSLRQLKSAFPAFASTKCVANGNVFNNDRRINGSGGNDFWESAPAMPDVLLHDLAAIFHPDIVDVSEDSLYFYRRLDE